MSRKTDFLGKAGPKGETTPFCHVRLDYLCDTMLHKGVEPSLLRESSSSETKA